LGYQTIGKLPNEIAGKISSLPEGLVAQLCLLPGA